MTQNNLPPDPAAKQRKSPTSRLTISSVLPNMTFNKNVSLQKIFTGDFYIIQFIDFGRFELSNLALKQAERV